MITVCFHEVCPSSDRVRRVGPGGPLVRRPAHLQTGPAGGGDHDVRGGADPAPLRAGDAALREVDGFLRRDRRLLERDHPVPRVLRVRGRHLGLREAPGQGPARPPAGRGAVLLARPRAQPAGSDGRIEAPVLSEYVLGLSAYYHDSAAALLKDGRIVAACQEERLSRKKHDAGFPARAVKYVLREGGIGPEQLDAVGFYDKPLLKFERMLTTYIATFPRSFGSFRKAMPVWIKEKLWVPSMIRKELRPYKGPILFAEHHMSHAASCFLVSPFEEAAILTVDGVGEWATASFGVGRGTDITLFKEIRFPHSLGLLYSAFTYYLGFKVNSAEYKVMGLAPYGKPVHFDRIMKEMVHLSDDGSFKLDMKYFSYDYGLTMTNGLFSEFFGGPPRKAETWMAEREFDIAASVQKVCEEIVLKMARYIHRETGLKNLCMAGAVALNCVA